jgi:serine/threonine-protein kinase
VLDCRSGAAVESGIATADDAIARTELASPPVETESGRELLQRRVALLARVILGIGVLVQAIILWNLFFSERETNTEPWQAVGQLLVLVVVAAILWRTRNGARALPELGVYDVVLTFLPTLFWCVARWDAPAIARPWMTLTLSAGNILMLRSVLVPSTGRRTFAMGLALVAIVAGWTYAFRARHVMPEHDPVWVETVTIAVMCLIGVIVATIASETIYGLRREVRRAMQLGQYTLVRKIGEGGMGVVWEAKHALLRRRTAIKLLPAERAGEDAIARFEREVQLTSALTHPNTIAIYDYGRSADGTFYYAMEHLDGIDLQQLVDRDGPQAPGLVAHVLVQLCDALAEAHGVGLIHRDVKPANVLLCERGGVPLVAKVLDFGLVKNVDAGSTETHRERRRRHAALHGARSRDDARPRRRAQRPLRGRRARLLPPDRQARLRGHERARGLRAPHARRARAPVGAREHGGAARSRSDHPRVPREEPRASPCVRRRARRAARCDRHEAWLHPGDGEGRVGALSHARRA